MKYEKQSDIEYVLFHVNASVGLCMNESSHSTASQNQQLQAKDHPF